MKIHKITHFVDVKIAYNRVGKNWMSFCLRKSAIPVPVSCQGILVFVVASWRFFCKLFYEKKMTGTLILKQTYSCPINKSDILWFVRLSLWKGYGTGIYFIFWSLLSLLNSVPGADFFTRLRILDIYRYYVLEREKNVNCMFKIKYKKA